MRSVDWDEPARCEAGPLTSASCAAGQEAPSDVGSTPKLEIPLERVHENCIGKFNPIGLAEHTPQNGASSR